MFQTVTPIFFTLSNLACSETRSNQDIYLNQGPRKSCFPLNLMMRLTDIRTDVQQYLQSSFAKKYISRLKANVFLDLCFLQVFRLSERYRERQKINTYGGCRFVALITDIILIICCVISKLWLLFIRVISINNTLVNINIIVGIKFLQNQTIVCLLL